MSEQKTITKRVISLGKIDYDGSGRTNCRVTVEIEVRDQGKGAELSICGTIWNPRETDCYSCGQNLDTIAEYIKTPAVRRLVEIWKRWHLNGMNAGCEHQRAEQWDKRPIDPSKPTNAYGKHHPNQKHDSWNMLVWVRPDEVSGGLMSVPCTVCGYKYGSSWLHENLPAEIIAELQAWPQAVRS